MATRQSFRTPWADDETGSGDARRAASSRTRVPPRAIHRNAHVADAPLPQSARRTSPTRRPSSTAPGPTQPLPQPCHGMAQARKDSSGRLKHCGTAPQMQPNQTGSGSRPDNPPRPAAPAPHGNSAAARGRRKRLRRKRLGRWCLSTLEHIVASLSVKVIYALLGTAGITSGYLSLGEHPPPSPSPPVVDCWTYWLDEEHSGSKGSVRLPEPFSMSSRRTGSWPVPSADRSQARQEPSASRSRFGSRCWRVGVGSEVERAPLVTCRRVGGSADAPR